MSFKSLPLQQYFKPLVTDHLSFIHNEKQCQPSSLKKNSIPETGVKRLFLVRTHQFTLTVRRGKKLQKNQGRKVSNKYTS